jgi:membrane protein required for colicin V production
MDGTAEKVTQFDLMVIVLLGVSGLVGWLRGATREVMTILAFGLAVLAALFGLRFSGPLLRHWVHPAWLATGLAGLIVFVLVYVAVRLASARLVHTVRQVSHLSLLDRLLGLGFGLTRGLVLLGALQLLFHAATPAERTPKWVANAALYPLAVDSGKILRLLAPQGSAFAKQLAPAVQHAVNDNAESSDQPVEKPH